jgi:3-oxoacyl-[acyl-carrier protein] reductase
MISNPNASTSPNGPSNRNSNTEFANRTALVTGASGGIGRATALLLAARGARVGVHYYSKQDAAESVVKEITANGGQAAAFKADVRAASQVSKLIASVEQTLGPIDLLINNAGDLIERLPLLKMTEARWHEVIDLNLTSVFLCMQTIAPSMIARKRGVIVNMSSLAAHNGGGPGAFAYSAAKAGVIALTKATAKELAPHGIRVNCVAPGLIGDTAFHARFTPPEAFDAATRTIPLGRAGTPEDVAGVIAFLCSEDSAFLAGETIEINGGMLMR